MAEHQERLVELLDQMFDFPPRPTTQMAATILDSDVIREIRREAKAEALREFADSIRTQEVLFRRSDGSGVKVNDLLRETARRYRTDKAGETQRPMLAPRPGYKPEPATYPLDDDFTDKAGEGKDG